MLLSLSEKALIPHSVCCCLQDTQEDIETSWLEFLTLQPRAAQLLLPESVVLTTLESTLSRYLKDVRRTTFKADKR